MNKNLLLLGLLSCALTTPALAEDVENADKAKTSVAENGAKVKENLKTESLSDNDDRQSQVAKACRAFRSADMAKR